MSKFIFLIFKMRNEFVELHTVGIEGSRYKGLMFQPNCDDTKMFLCHV